MKRLLTLIGIILTATALSRAATSETVRVKIMVSGVARTSQLTGMVVEYDGTNWTAIIREMYVNNITNSLGVGVSSATQKLDVDGAIAFGQTSATKGYWGYINTTQLVHVCTHTGGVTLASSVTNVIDSDVTSP